MPDLPTITRYWDEAAPTFDTDADHGLRDPAVRAAWAARLGQWLPPAPSDILDVGCGTGSLALLLAEAGHRVTAYDLSPRMVAAARAKCEGHDVSLSVADAAEPPVGRATVDVVVVRHLMWTLPDPYLALARWSRTLRDGGRLVLVEGRWAQPGSAGPDGAPVVRPRGRGRALAGRRRPGRAGGRARAAGLQHRGTRPVGGRRAVGTKRGRRALRGRGPPVNGRPRLVAPPAAVRGRSSRY